MNIFIVTGIFPPDIGGPATYVPAIATAFANKEHKITVLTLSDQLDHDDSGYPFQVIRLPRKTFKFLRWLITLLTILRFARKADVLYVNGLALEAALASKVLRKPMVMKVVGDFAWERARNYGWVDDDFEGFQGEDYGWRVRGLKALRSWWVQQADRVIVPSAYLAKWVLDWGVSERKYAVIYNAVEAANGVLPAEIALATAVRLVVVGRLVSWKHVDEILEAVADFDDVGVIIVGDGPERKRLEAQVSRLGMHERVYLAGFRSKAETQSLMAAGNIFVLFSSYEGFPHVIVEAMQLGLPVLTTTAGGVPEIIKDGVNGLFVDRTRASLVNRLRQLMDHPELAHSLSTAAQETISKSFRSMAMVTETEKILQQAAKIPVL